MTVLASLVLFLLLCSPVAAEPLRAVTPDGREVLLNPDGTWSFVKPEAPASEPAAPTPPAERPAFAVGEKWIRNDGVYELTRIEDDLYVFTAAQDREIRLTRNLGVVKITAGAEVEWDIDPPTGPTWPIEVGSFGSSSTRWRSARRPIPGAAQWFDGRVQAGWSVDSYEDVAVDGRSVKAFKILQWIETIGPFAPRRVWEFVMWYAPEVRQMVAPRRPRRTASGESPDPSALVGLWQGVLGLPSRDAMRGASAAPAQLRIVGEAGALKWSLESAYDEDPVSGDGTVEISGNDIRLRGHFYPTAGRRSGAEPGSGAVPIVYSVILDEDALQATGLGTDNVVHSLKMRKTAP